MVTSGLIKLTSSFGSRSGFLTRSLGKGFSSSGPLKVRPCHVVVEGALETVVGPQPLVPPLSTSKVWSKVPGWTRDRGPSTPSRCSPIETCLSHTARERPVGVADRVSAGRVVRPVVYVALEVPASVSPLRVRGSCRSWVWVSGID